MFSDHEPGSVTSFSARFVQLDYLTLRRWWKWTATFKPHRRRTDGRAGKCGVAFRRQLILPDFQRSVSVAVHPFI